MCWIEQNKNSRDKEEEEEKKLIAESFAVMFIKVVHDLKSFHP